MISEELSTRKSEDKIGVTVTALLSLNTKSTHLHCVAWHYFLSIP